MSGSLKRIQEFAHCDNGNMINDTIFDPEFLAFAECYGQTIFTWAPACYLWLFTPLFIYVFRRAKHPPLQWQATIVAKSITLCICIFSLSLSFLKDLMIYGIIDSYSLFLPRAVLLISMVDLVFLTLCCRMYGVPSSGFVFTSLFAFLALGSVEFLYSLAILNTESSIEHDRGFSSLCFVIYYVFLSFTFATACFADGQISDVSCNQVSPETRASFLNRITFWWFNRLTLKGYKVPLEQKDLWELNQKDRAESLLPRWEQFWKPNNDFYVAKKAENSIRYPDQKNLLWSEENDCTTSKKADYQKPTSAQKLSKPSVLRPSFRVLKARIVLSVLMRLASDLLQFLSPLLLSALIAFVQDRNQRPWKGYFYAILLFGGATLCSVAQNYSIIMMGRSSINVKTMLMSAIYSKSLKLSNASAGQKKTGEIVNLMANDVSLIQDVIMHMLIFISSPFQIIIALYLLYWQLGLSILAGVFALIAIIPINYFLTSRQRVLQMEQVKQKDNRFKLLNEVLEGIKVIKLYAWEDSFGKRIQDIRNNELRALMDAGYVGSVSMFAWNCVPFLVAVACFACYVFVQGETLTPQNAFVSISLFNILRMPMAMIPVVLSYIVRANVSNKRIKDFLASDEVDPDAVSRVTSPNSAVTIKEADFCWGHSDTDKLTLSDIDLDICPGELVAIVGSVGSGKTSLLCSIMGELEKIRGSVLINGSISYAPQVPWIINSTLRENIIFSKPLNSAKYEKIVRCCELNEDLESLQAGDLTELGEKGVNLSGGQKQRISLARTAYNEAEIYLFDDPLSSVDPRVGSRIFRNVFSNQGSLKSKTRLIVTNGLQYVRHFDRIIVMSDGFIKEQGTYDQLLKSGGTLSEMLIKYVNETIDESADDEGNILNDVLSDLNAMAPRVRSRLISTKSGETDPFVDDNSARARSRLSCRSTNTDKRSTLDKQKGQESGIAPTNKLIQEETVNVGRVKTDVYLSYVKAMGYCAFVTSIMLMTVSYGFGVGANVLLAEWSNEGAKELLANGTNPKVDNTLYIGLYTAMGICQAILLLVCALLMTYAMIKASNRLHSTLVNRLLRAPLRFFETTPMGRILNRCGKDIDVVDTSLAQTMRTWLGCVLNVISTLFVISWAQPYFVMVIVPMSIFYFFILRFYISTSRQLKRLESATRSPIFVHFQETLAGLLCIRAFNVQGQFLAESQRRIDQNQMCSYPNFISNRWLAVRLEMLGNFVVFCAALFTVINRDTSTGGAVGLAISYALSVTQGLNWAVRMTSDLETNVVAVERIREYSEIETEANWTTPDDLALSDKWPERGEIDIDDLCLRYRPELELSLKNLTCKIKQGEKIGIAGRTGAGKSSVTVALFRIAEWDSGKIHVDNVDIKRIGLKTLRSRLSLIPQEPTIFSGTLRFNLDPFGCCSDEQLWSAVEKSHLKILVSNMPAKLDEDLGGSAVAGSSKLSFGQMQLVCLARALLRKTKILIMDEATASLDYETDELIQRTIKEEFANCTVITIAHRINTIIDSDRIMVLASGQIIEFDEPKALLSRKDSAFSAMVEEGAVK